MSQSLPPATAALVDERIHWLDAEIEAALCSGASAPRLYDIARYHLGWRDEALRPLPEHQQREFGGKRLRGVLCILAGEAVGGRGEDVAPAGAAIELIHNFSLVHDDVEDGDEERRHRPTVWKLWGVPHAVNVGSHMQALVNVATLRLAQRGQRAETVVAVLRVITRAILRMTEGQYLDMAAQDEESVTLDAYFEMTGGKTAALVEAALRVGVLIGGGNEDQVEVLGRFGREFGLAFQARDDYLGIWGEPERTGKPVGSDILRGKRSLPVVYALAQPPLPIPITSGGQDYPLRQALRERDVPTVMHALERLGTKEFVGEVVERHTVAALASLAAAQVENPYGRAIAAIARYALGRES
ncbi:MAG: polyprenyl synthetase family protein, partial [Armatimonadetes bacterium]|nr:polyprenyl synthetase family protein [Armatimonadota bacterium]